MRSKTVQQVDRTRGIDDIVALTSVIEQSSRHNRPLKALRSEIIHWEEGVFAILGHDKVAYNAEIRKKIVAATTQLETLGKQAKSKERNSDKGVCSPSPQAAILTVHDAGVDTSSLLVEQSHKTCRSMMESNLLFGCSFLSNTMGPEWIEVRTPRQVVRGIVECHAILRVLSKLGHRLPEENLRNLHSQFLRFKEIMAMHKINKLDRTMAKDHFLEIFRQVRNVRISMEPAVRRAMQVLRLDWLHELLAHDMRSFTCVGLKRQNADEEFHRSCGVRAW